MPSLATRLQAAIDSFVEDRRDYYQQWIYEEPIIISEARDERLAHLQKVMHRCITHLAHNYDQYSEVMPLSSAVQNVLNIYRATPYRPGTYRTDFVYDPTGQEKLIEITCRFALNGVFTSAVMNAVARDYARRHLLEITPCEDRTVALTHHLASYLDGVESVCLLKGSDDRNESKLFVRIFADMGLPVHMVCPTEILAHADCLKRAWVISELSFDEILGLSTKAHEVLVECRLSNDFRTIFLAHDKRFFALLGDDRFLEAALSPEDRIFLKKYHIPTFSKAQAPAIWESARKQREQWILKHRALGKSVEIYAGPTLTQPEWESIIDSPNMDNFVLQQWVPSTKVTGRIGDQQFNDYIVGTVLFFDDHYFGHGEFRTSSYPITNRVDHRKACALTLPEAAFGTLTS